MATWTLIEGGDVLSKTMKYDWIMLLPKYIKSNFLQSSSTCMLATSSGEIFLEVAVEKACCVLIFYRVVRLQCHVVLICLLCMKNVWKYTKIMHDY